MKYINVTNIRKIVKEYSGQTGKAKRCGKDFFAEIDLVVYELVLRCCRQYNGGKATLDRTIVAMLSSRERGAK